LKITVINEVGKPTDTSRGRDSYGALERDGEMSQKESGGRQGNDENDLKTNEGDSGTGIMYDLFAEIRPPRRGGFARCGCQM